MYLYTQYKFSSFYDMIYTSLENKVSKIKIKRQFLNFYIFYDFGTFSDPKKKTTWKFNKKKLNKVPPRFNLYAKNIFYIYLKNIMCYDNKLI